MITAETLVKHTAHLRWRDQHGEEHSERHAAWTARQATTDAYRRARSMIRAGQARCYRIEHHERPFDGGSVAPINDPFAIPAAA
jgi:hypothetical protein